MIIIHVLEAKAQIYMEHPVMQQWIWLKAYMNLKLTELHRWVVECGGTTYTPIEYDSI